MSASLRRRGRRDVFARRLGIELVEFGEEFVVRLLVVWVFENTVHGTDCDTLRVIEMAYAFGAFSGIDDIDLVALRNRAVGAFRLTDIAVDTFVSNHQGHFVVSFF
jgi:hypothetical protein